MKKQILSITSVFFLAGVLTLSSCKKDDVTAPTLTLKGNSTMDINLGDTYTDEGATATDEEDGDITPTSTGTVDNKKVGTYTITYSASDEAGNMATEVKRTVRVK